MCDHDIEAARRARDLERHHRRTAERRAQGLCLKCGKRPPAPHRSQCEPCMEKQRARDLARYHRRTAERIAPGPVPEVREAPARTRAQPVRAVPGEGRRRRPGPRLEAAGRGDPATGPRTGHGLRARAFPPGRPNNAAPPGCACDAGSPRPWRGARCASHAPRSAGPASARSMRRRKPRGSSTGGRNVETRRRIGREKSAKRLAARLAAGLCTSCGKRPPADGGTTCEPCRGARRVFERERYAARRAAGLCGYCGEPTLDGGSRCGPCAVRETECRDPEKKNAAARRLYARRRAEGLCTDCGEPSQGAARCEPCARRSYERSQYVRGMPLYPPQYTVVELTTGEDHGTFDSWDEVAMCLAFARLSLEQVEVLTDQSPMATWAAWE